MFTLTRLRLPIAVIVGIAFAALLALAAFSSGADARQTDVAREKPDVAAKEGTEAAAKKPSDSIESHIFGDGWHWARAGNPFTLKVGDNLTSTSASDWDKYLNVAAGTGEYASDGQNDWSKQERFYDGFTYSDPLDMTIVPGLTNDVRGRTTPKQCRPTSGRVEVCNESYGKQGWVGLATVWFSGGHITQGTAKLNDTYFNDSRYTDEWKLGTLCQEVGHTLGLGHQSEDPTVDMDTCMDYYNYPDLLNTQPNRHDYEQLDAIYTHTDSTTTIKRTPRALNEIDSSDPSQRGRLIHQEGRLEVYERDFGGGHKMRTFVILADEEDGQPQQEQTQPQQQKQEEQPQQQQKQDR